MRVALGLSVLLFATLAGAQVVAPIITELTVPYSGSHPQAIIAGPDKAIWFTDPGTNSIGHAVGTADGSFTIIEFPIPTPNAGPNGITVGPDKASMWFTESDANKIGRITMDGVITEYPLPTPASSPTSINSALWFTESNANQIGNIATDGTIREIPIPTPASTPVGISEAANGAGYWFTELDGNNIGRIDFDGTITEYPLPTPNSGPLGIGVASDGSIAFAESRANRIAFFSPSAPPVFQEYPLPLAASGVSGSADGCFTLSNANEILCYFGDFMEFPLPTPSSNPQGIAFALQAIPGAGTTGYTTWFAEAAAGKIGWLNAAPPQLPLVYPSVGTSPILSTAIVGTPYSASLSVARGTAPYTWSAMPGALPAGLTLSNVNSDTATLSGILTAPGLQTFTISVTDSIGETAAQTFQLQVDAASCIISLSSPGQSFPAVGGVGTISVTAPPGCPWDVVGGGGYVTVQDGNESGLGSGSVHYIVIPNMGSGPESATLNVGGQSFTIEEEGGDGGQGLRSRAPLDFYVAPEMPHLAFGGGWRTSFTLVNNGTASPEVWTSFYGNDGNLLSLPLMFPQQTSQSPSSATWIDRTLAPNQSLIFEASGSASNSLTEGLAAVATNSSLTNGNVGGFSIFHYDPSGQEAVVPLGGSGYVIPFDNTGGVTTGIAIASTNFDAASYPIILLDDTGARIGNGTESITLPGYGHTSFVLPDQFPVTANRRGTVVLGSGAVTFHVDIVTTPLSTLGIRYTPPGTLTTIPSLGIPSIYLPPFGVPDQTLPVGGTMPHIASGSGWQTTFVLSNVPAVPDPTFFSANPPSGSPAQAALSFFDDNGNPLTLPLTFPQTGATATASSITQTIPANGTLYIQTSGDVGTALLTGSAQLTGANGFAIFRYNPNGQEAVVPIQTAPLSYTGASVLAFDNTNNIATGVAVSNGSAQAVTVPVIIRDDQGNQIGTDTISLAANGHTSFMLATQYPATANIRGTLEFAIPGAGTSSAATIGVLGIRSPPQLTFTTLPALPK